LITVTPDGPGGSGHDQRTGTSGDLGQAQLPPLISTLNRAAGGEPDGLPAALQDRNRARPAFGPFRRPTTEAKEFRYAVSRPARACRGITADTSPSQALSGVALAAVSRAGRRPSRPSQHIEHHNGPA